MRHRKQGISLNNWKWKKSMQSLLLLAAAMCYLSGAMGSQVATPDKRSQTELSSLTTESDSNAEKQTNIDETKKENINLLFIMTDQQRFDMIGAVQEQMSRYDGKTKVYTPNLDRLMKESTSFMRHYTQCASCAPARSTLATGCTIERTGVQTNHLVDEKYYQLNHQLFGEKIEAMRSFDQILAEEKGYVCEYFGKWHMPKNLYYQSGKSKLHRSIRYNSYDFQTNIPMFDDSVKVRDNLQACLDASKDKLRKNINGTEQINTFSEYPYTPTKLDSRYGYPGGTPLIPINKGGEFKSWESSQNCIIGRDSLDKEFSSTHCLATSALNALDRLVSEQQPWSLTVSFNSPHPPMVSTGEYFDKYWHLRNDFFVPPSNDAAHMTNSAYKPDKNHKLQHAGAVKEWMASYYALVEEVDYHIGRLLEKLDEAKQNENTLVIFTSDHGESLGAHARKGKGTFYEESSHVPLVLRLPGRIPKGKTVGIPTSSIDVFSTILDYTGNEMHDDSDGKSLRRFIDETNHNEAHDNEAVVAEWDSRDPTGDGKLTHSLGDTPNFMVVKGDWKLMIPKYEYSHLKDQMYNIALDPFEMENVLGDNGMYASDETIGKAEHLKALLHGWMERMDGNKEIYSNPVFNAGEGRGDIHEVTLRNTWRRLPIWVSDKKLLIGKPALVDTLYTRNEFLYIGRTTKDSLTVHSIELEGTDSHFFSLSGFLVGSIYKGGHKRVKVTFRSSRNDFDVLDAQIRVTHSEGEDIVIKLQYSGTGDKFNSGENDALAEMSVEIF